MAQKKSEMVKVKALIYLKYDKERVAPDKEFKVRKSDAADMAEKGYIEIIEDDDSEENDNPNGNDGADPKAGE